MTEPAWHAEDIGRVLERVDSRESGLSGGEAARRLAQVGPNRLKRTRPASAMRILANQLASMVVFLLAAAALVAFVLGDRIESAAIGAVLALNTAIGFVTELRARRAMDALLQFEVPRAAVVRDGEVRAISSSDL